MRPLVRQGKSSRRASTIIETIIAIGLLTAGFAVFVRLIVFGLKGMDQGEDAVHAAGLAGSEITRLRTEAKMDRWSDLLALNGSKKTVDGFEISIEVAEREVFSPSTAWEAPYLTTGEARHLKSSLAQAVVRVRGHGAETVLTTLLGRPRRILADPAIVLDNLPTSMTANQKVTLKATLKADDGTEIPALFRWLILPETGNGSLVPLRNGREAVLRNNVATSYDTQIIVPGKCKLRVSTLYFGEEVTSKDYEVDMQP